ncbi:MAG: hypothetical protein QW273_01465 [Candidatus Pacearchaeota archaeon]
MAYNFSNLLNTLNELGLFTYILPFMIIFSVVFGILEKTNLFGQNKKGIHIVISLSVAGISLLFDTVPLFFSVLFPKLGIGIGLLLLVMIILGFLYGGNVTKLKFFGWIILGMIIIWTLIDIEFFSSFGRGSFNFLSFIEDYLPLILILGILIGGIILVTKDTSSKKENKKEYDEYSH